MPTPASARALQGLRDVSTLEWCVIPLLSMVVNLVWEYSWWNRSFAGIWLIFLFGYFHFYVAIIIVLSLKTIRAKVITISCIYGVAIVANIICLGFLGWVY